MKFTHEIQDDILIIRPIGDLLGARDEAEIFEFADSQNTASAKHCVLDISEVAYMNSSGISLVIRLLGRFRSRGGELVPSGANKSVRKLLAITKLDKVFTLTETTEEAIAHLRSRD